MKIRLILSGEDQGQIFRNTILRKEFSNHGIEFVSSDSNNYDISIIHKTCLLDSHLEKPVIILERIDSAVLLSRDIIKHPNVKLIVKNTIHRDWKYNNYNTIDGRYHCHTIYSAMSKKEKSSYLQSINHEDDFVRTPSILIDETDSKKIVTGWSFAHYPKFRNHINIAVDMNSRRSYNVHFAGTMKYGKYLIEHHRQKCVDTINQLKCRKCITFCGRKQNATDYLNTILNTRIVVSPWGFGESCYRDYEAIFCGSILVKPDSDYIESFPDIFKSDYYIKCSPNFSDLNNITLSILSNWDNYTQMRVNALNLLKESMNPINLVKHIKMQLDKIV